MLATGAPGEVREPINVGTSIVVTSGALARLISRRTDLPKMDGGLARQKTQNAITDYGSRGARSARPRLRFLPTADQRKCSMNRFYSLRPVVVVLVAAGLLTVGTRASAAE